MALVPQEQFCSRKLAYSDPDELTFGIAKFPVVAGRGDMVIGGGQVWPQIVPHPRPGSEESHAAIMREYHRMCEDALATAVALGAPGLVIELEHVNSSFPDNSPQWVGDIVGQTRRQTEDYYQKYGLKGLVVSTVGDIRKPTTTPMRDGHWAEAVIQAFEESAKNGADVLSIETMGGKEVFDYAIARQDIKGILFGTGVLGSLDMAWIWPQIVAIAKKYGCVAGGDTDCGRGNVAMFLAGGLTETQLPHSIAVLARALAAARTLVAYECGATGPTKDCAYEDPIIKLITGVPVTMEGKCAACAHHDLLSNINHYLADIVSNEAVQYGDMFADSTVASFTDLLVDEVAMMNAARAIGKDQDMRDIFIAADKYRDPQPFISAPENAYQIASAIVGKDNYYNRARAAMIAAADVLSEGFWGHLSDYERSALDRARRTLESLTDSEEKFTEECLAEYVKIANEHPEVLPGFHPEWYGLKTPSGVKR